MSIAEKIKKAKRKASSAVVMGALAMAAVTTSSKAKASEPEAKEKLPAVKVEIAEAQQQMFEAAVRAKLPADEIAKYINFPEFIPVDENGQLDKKKVEESFERGLKENKDELRDIFNQIASTITIRGQYDLAAAHGDVRYTERFDRKAFDTAYTRFAKEVAKDNPEMESLLEGAKRFFIRSYGEPNAAILSQAAKEQDEMHGYDPASTASMAVLLSAVALGSLAVAGILSFNKEMKKERNTLLAGAAALTVGAIAMGSYFEKNFDKMLKERDPAALKPFYVEFMGSMHQAYIEQQVNNEQTRQTTVAKEQFALQAQQFSDTGRK